MLARSKAWLITKFGHELLHEEHKGCPWMCRFYGRVGIFLQIAAYVIGIFYIVIVNTVIELTDAEEENFGTILHTSYLTVAMCVTFALGRLFVHQSYVTMLNFVSFGVAEKPVGSPDY